MLQRKLDDLDESRKNVVLLSGDSDDSKGILSTYQEFSNINSKVDKYIVNKKVIYDRKSYETNFKLERLPLPFFNGKIRNYSRFRTDFTDFVRPYLSPQRAAYALRRCLHSDVQDFLGSCENDVDKMLERLDRKYADPGKIVKCIVFEIRKFRKLDDDTVLLIKFVNVLESGFRDLSGLGLSHEIRNANVVALIESKLPRILQLEWYRLHP